MVKPAPLTPNPPFVLMLLGGAVATLLLIASLFLAPVLGLPFIDMPHLLGGVFTTNAEIALWLGFWLFFLVAAFILSPLLGLLWTRLPGDAVGVGSALMKGLIWSVILAVAAGLLLPLLGVLNRLPEETVTNPGFFALNLGVLGAVTLLVAHLLYGTALALVADMAKNIDPRELLGWPSYEHGETYEILRVHRRRRGELSE